MSEKTVTESDTGKNQPAADKDRPTQRAEPSEIEKLLNSPRDLSATIREVGWQDGTQSDVTGAICLLLSVPGATRYPVVVPLRSDNSMEIEFIELCESLDIRPENSLDELEGTAVDLDVQRKDGTEFAVLKTDESRLRGQIVEDFEIVTDADQELPSTVETALSRLYRYRKWKIEGIGIPVTVRDLTVTEEQLSLHLQEGWGDITFERARTDNVMVHTSYEALVEHVGQGVVQAIEGEQIWIARSKELKDEVPIGFSNLSYGEKKKHYDNYIASATDVTGDWSIFSAEPDSDPDYPVFVVFLIGILLCIAGLFSEVALTTIGAGILLIALYLHRKQGNASVDGYPAN